MSSSINGTGIFTHSYGRALSQMRSRFDSLSLQLATGQRSQDYAGLGNDRSVALSVRGKLSSVESYQDNLKQVGLRTNLMMTSLTSLTKIAADTRGDLDPTSYLKVGNRTVSQQAAMTRFDTAIEALGVNVAGVYLFGGRDVDSRPVASTSEIMEGTVGQAGLKTVTAERKLADLGTDGRGRLTFNAESTGTGLGATAPADLTNAGAGGAGFVTDGNVLSITVGATTENFTIDDGGINTLTDLVNAINGTASINGDVTASIVDGQLKISGDAGTTGFTVGGTAAPELGIVSPAYDPDTTVRMSEDFAGSPFGFKLVGAETNITGATASGPTGTPPHVDFTLAAQPTAGQTVRFALELPDGTFEDITLTATADTPPGKGQFTIGATVDATVDNLRTSMDTAIQLKADTALVAASHIQASRDFFDDPPLRVVGSPATATAQQDGTATTFAWYRGENGPDSARMTQVARIDSTLTANYGARANEDGIREFMANLAAFATMELDPDDTIGKQQYGELIERMRPALAEDGGAASLQAVAVDITHVAAFSKAADDRHKASKATLETMLANVEGISKEEVAANILALQTNLTASYQTTAMISQLSLVNFL